MKEYISCAVCGKQFKQITQKHLKTHNMTYEEYVSNYPDAPLRSESSTALKRAVATRVNETRKGVPRSQNVINKIKKTKSENPSEAWNKGIPMSDDQKQHLSETHKEAFRTGKRRHWNKGKETSDDTKRKISDTLSKRHLPARLEKEEKKQQDQMQLKQEIEDITKEIDALLDIPYSLTTNYYRRLEAIVRHQNICKQSNLKLLRVFEPGSNVPLAYNLKCGSCGTEFSYTSQYFHSAKLESRVIDFCPECHPREKATSLAEKEILDYVRSLLQGEEVLANNRSVLGNRELDIYIPSKRIAIEYTGLYWHSEQVHYEKYNLLEKHQRCLTHCVRLITIFEDEWLNKKEICKGRLAHILGAGARQPIHARKCSIEKISAKEANRFLEENHIQGRDNSSIRVGAFHEGILVAVMTFKPTNMSKGGDGSKMELSRFSLRMGVVSNGLAKRLFNWFLKNYSATEIISYSDNRWNTGQLYENLNFTYKGNSPANYWYVKPNVLERKHRSVFMKHKLVEAGFDAQKTEKEIMDENGYLRIWDCGNGVWVMEKA